MDIIPSSEKQIATIMQSYDLTADFLGSLCALEGFKKLNQPRISQALRGTKPFTNEEASFLLELLGKLSVIIDQVRLVQPVFRDPRLAKRVLDLHRNNQLLLIVESVDEGGEVQE